ncbi:unnamed protein product [Lactuca saligna]|uniref:RNA helicase n=1 Tax=Lactuca saligna TaxID=75948 RepID=A0AA35Z4Q2_LACSI|nr:unnamed protein product [Lactuca saligna]
MLRRSPWLFFLVASRLHVGRGLLLHQLENTQDSITTPGFRNREKVLVTCSRLTGLRNTMGYVLIDEGIVDEVDYVLIDEGRNPLLMSGEPSKDAARYTVAAKVAELLMRGLLILETIIAEISVTIPGIKYVIDPGWVKVRSYSPDSGIESLTVLTTSKAQALQRSGRAGREGAGKCFCLYPESIFEGHDDSTTPEIKRGNLSNVIL